jgi:hypothetical protein
MQRRDSLAMTGGLSGLDPVYLAAKEELIGGKAYGWPVPKRQYSPPFATILLDSFA